MEMRTVPFFNYPALFTAQEEELVNLFRAVGRRGAFIMQKDLLDFEKHMADYLGVRYALGVANCTDGLHIALRAAGIQPGDEVIFCSHTMVATAAAIHFAGGLPVPVDCASDHMIDPAAVEAAVTPRTRAIMPTQLNGRTCDMDALQAIADRHHVLIVEDAAQAFGARYKGKATGTFGISSATSFYPAKTLGSLGDAGAVFTNDPVVYDKMGRLHDHGRGEDGEVTIWGFNSRLDNLQAAILDYKLARYEDEIKRRREIAALYQQQLGDVNELALPPAPDSDPRYFDIFQNYELDAERRDDLRAYLKEHGVGTLIQWGGKAVHQFEKLGLGNYRLPYTERMFTRCLVLPLNTALTDADVDYVCAQLRAFYGYKA